MGTDKIVKFEEWCGKCKHAKVDEVKEPCDECLSHPANLDTRKPVNYEERK